MKTFSPVAAKQQLESKADKICFIDIRSQDDFLSGHVPGAICVPLDQLEARQDSIPKDKLVILSCQSGKRSAQAIKLLAERGFENIAELEGGFSAWKSAGLPIQRVNSSIPIMRQVLIAAGALVLMGSVLSLAVDPRFMVIPMFLGAGLMFAGATGWCGLALLLQKMPWNRP